MMGAMERPPLRAAPDPILRAFLELWAADPMREVAVGPGLCVRRQDVEEGMRCASRALDGLRLALGAVIGLQVDPGPSFLTAYLACRRAGLCVLPLDASVPRGEQLRVALHLGACAIWRPGAFDSASVLGGIEPLRGRRTLPETACLKLTSGSTGDPVGIAVSAQALFTDGDVLVRSMGLTAADRFLCAVPMSHSYGLSVLATPAWILGATLVFPAQEDLLEIAERFEATFFPSVPSWFEARLRVSNDAPLPPSLRLCLSAGAPLRPETARAWRERFGLPIRVLYGCSECGGITYDRRGDAAERGSVGTPVEGVEIELEPVLGGAGGRVVVRSPAVATRYVPSQPGNGARLGHGAFRSDDLARFANGELWLCGRQSDWINVKGKKVNPREVEGVLAELPGVIEVAVLSQPLPTGQGESVRAVIACAEGRLRYRDVVLWCRTRLAPHKVPRKIAFVREIPRTVRGKLDRRALLSL